MSPFFLQMSPFILQMSPFFLQNGEVCKKNGDNLFSKINGDIKLVKKTVT